MKIQFLKLIFNILSSYVCLSVILNLQSKTKILLPGVTREMEHDATEVQVKASLCQESTDRVTYLTDT